MSKTLEQIQAEIAAATGISNKPKADVAAIVDVPAPPASEPAAATSPEDAFALIEKLAAISGVSAEKLLIALESAESVNLPAKEVLPEGAKVYYTSFPNSGVMVQRGPAHAERVEFLGNRLITTDSDVIAYMESIADRPGSGIYTKSHIEVSAEVRQMQEDLRAAAKAAHSKMLAAGEKVA